MSAAIIDVECSAKEDSYSYADNGTMARLISAWLLDDVGSQGAL